MTEVTSSYNHLPIRPWQPGIPAECGCGVSAVRYGYVMAEQADEAVIELCGAQAQPSCPDCGLALAYPGALAAPAEPEEAIP